MYGLICDWGELLNGQWLRKDEQFRRFEGGVESMDEERGFVVIFDRGTDVAQCLIAVPCRWFSLGRWESSVVLKKPLETSQNVPSPLCALSCTGVVFGTMWTVLFACLIPSRFVFQDSTQGEPLFVINVVSCTILSPAYPRSEAWGVSSSVDGVYMYSSSHSGLSKSSLPSG